MDCIFCKIASGEIPSNKVYEDESVIAFYDLDPKAPIHILVIPKEHMDSAQCVDEKNSRVIGKVFEAVAKISKELGLEDGFRVVNNCGRDGGQTVGHIHFHLMAGRTFGWPPG